MSSQPAARDRGAAAARRRRKSLRKRRGEGGELASARRAETRGPREVRSRQETSAQVPRTRSAQNARRRVGYNPRESSLVDPSGLQALNAAPAPPVSSGDRLSLTLFFAIVAHAILILGVSFSPLDPDRALTSTMEVILVQHKSPKPPDKADFLAQASQQGGGNAQHKERPSTPAPAPFTGAKPHLVAVSPPVHPSARVVADKPRQPTTAAPPAHPKSKPVLAQEKVHKRHQVVKERPPRKPPKQPRPHATPQPKPAARPQPTQTVNATTLVSRSLAMASLSAEIDDKLKAYAERPRQKWITARTRDYKYAAYMQAWRQKVERVGNLNYPDAARRRNLSGDLLLDVALNADGTVRRVIVRRSSGHRILDDAAIRIVKLAAPYAPFPPAIHKQTDILHIERTWVFLSSNHLTYK